MTTSTPAVTRRSALALAGLALAGAALAPALALAAEPEGFVPSAGSTVEPSVPTAVAGDRVEGEFYAFEIPEHWRGRVSVEVEGASAWVRPLCCPQAQLVSVHVRDAAREPFPQPGNPDHSYVYGVDNGRGQYVYVDAYNLPMWMSDGLWEGLYAPRWGVADPEAAAAELVDLSTGGAATLEQARADFSSVFGASYGFCREAFLPSLEVAMDEGWARLAALEASGWESETLRDFAGRASLELADGSGGLSWLFDLAGDPQVAAWAEVGLPVARFLADVAAPILSLPDLAGLSALARGRAGGAPRGWFSYELSYAVLDPRAATLAGYAGALRGGGVEGWIYSVDGDDPALLEEASARALVASALDSALLAIDLLGAAYEIGWACLFPTGVGVAGTTTYSDGLVEHAVEGGTLLVTSHYSVTVPDRLFPEGFECAYENRVLTDFSATPDGPGGEGPFVGYALRVSANGAPGGFGVHLCKGGPEGFVGIQGAFTANRVVGESDGWKVVVLGDLVPDSDPEALAAAEAEVETYASLVTAL